jgi:hypothetical protein
VVRKLSQNQGAAFSDRDYVTLAGRAETDERLAVNLGVRLDMPSQLLQDLLAKATETVRARLLTAVSPDRQAAIQNILATASDKVLRKATGPRDFSRAIARIDKMQSIGQLNDQAIAEFAAAGQHEELTVGLARLCTTPVELIERLMQNARILVACKAAELRWPTFHAVLKARFAYDLSATDISQTKSDFLKLSVPTARRMLRFWLVRGATKTDA